MDTSKAKGTTANITIVDDPRSQEEKIFDWHYCYQGNWNKEVAPESISHPAKFARLLIKRIYELALTEGWLKPGDVVGDVFAGVALGAKDALFNGINWVGIELEAHFVDMANGVNCTGVSKADYQRFYGRWKKFNQKGDRHWCPQCLAELEKEPDYKEMPLNNVWQKRRKRMEKLIKKIRKRLDAVDLESLSDDDKALYYQYRKLLRLPNVLPMPLPGTRAGEFAKRVNGPTQATMFDQIADVVYKRNSGKIPTTQPHCYEGNLDRFRKFVRGEAQAVMVQGDSRQLLKIVRGIDGIVSSPPYVDSLNSEHHGFNLNLLTPDYPGRKFHKDRKSKIDERHRSQKYGEQDAQLGGMDEGDFDATISSPMFSGNSGGTGEASQQGIDKALFRRHSGSMNKGLMSDEDGNLGNMGHGDFDAVISSRVYGDSLRGQTDGGYEERKRNRAGNLGGKVPDRTYGETDGQIAKLPEGDLDATIASPPFEDSVGSDDARKRGGILLSDPKRKKDKNLTGSYGVTEGQLGLETKDTFWNASRTILEQLFILLKQGGVSIWVLKDYIRDGEIVEFSNQWRRLCEAVGFEYELMIRAWLTETEMAQFNLQGEIVRKIKSKKSFFRRVHEQKGLPPIDWEIVLVMRKP